jgi:hypothetical protein
MDAKLFSNFYNVISYALGFAISPPGAEPKASDIIVRNYFILEVSMWRNRLRTVPVQRNLERRR